MLSESGSYMGMRLSLIFSKKKMEGGDGIK